MRTTALLSALAVACAVPVVTAPAAHAADVKIELPMTAFRDVLADDDHVYVTGGGSAGVVVRDLTGAAVTTITGQPGAAGMALSPDGGTLYVALSQGDAISAIDTTTLVETARYATGASTCPQHVTAVGTSIWFGYGCASAGDIGVVDLSGETPAVTTARAAAGYGYTYAPFVEARVDGAVTRLLAAPPGGYHLHSYTVAGTALTMVTTREVAQGNLNDIAVTADGTRVVTAAGSPYHHARYATADLSSDGLFGEGLAYPNAAAVTDGFVAAGTDASYAHDVRVYTAAGSLVRTWETGTRLQPHGLAYSPDGSRLFAVSGDWGATPRYLHVLVDPMKAATSITLTRPSTAKIRTAFTVTGKLTSGLAIPAGQTLQITRSSTYGTVTLPSVTTGTGGAFSFTDTVRKRGAYTYQAAWAGDATHVAASGQTAFKVLGLTPAVTIATSASTYRYGATGSVTAKLGTTYSSRVLQLSATPYGYSKRVLKTAAVDGNGYLKGSTTLSRRTTFAATFGGDEVYEPRTVTKVVTVGAHLKQYLDGYYTTSGSYKVFRSYEDPVLGVVVSPNRMGTCMAFTAQHYVSGAWRTIATASCLPLDQYSIASAILRGTHNINVPHRMRSTFMGDVSNTRTTGAWQYLRFTP